MGKRLPPWASVPGVLPRVTGLVTVFILGRTLQQKEHEFHEGAQLEGKQKNKLTKLDKPS